MTEPAPASQYTTTFQVVSAILDHLEHNRMDEAMDLYTHCQEDVGFVVMARSSHERPFQVKLARMFFGAKDYEKAALILEANGEHRKAAELYERTDQYGQAAEMWIKVGDNGRAAINFERQGSWQSAADYYAKERNFVKAAYCFEKAVNHFLAGKYYLEIGKYQKSLEMLQRVGEEEANFLSATLLIGDILSRHGYLDMAEAKYRSVIRSIGPGASSLPVYYNLARLLEHKGKVEEAGEYYRHIVLVEPGYQDAAARMKACAGRQPEPDRMGVLEMQAGVQAVSEEVLARHEAGPGGNGTAKNNIVSMMDGFEFLKSTALFEELSLAEMKRLWTICEDRFFKPGEILIEQYTPGRSLFIIREGEVSVQKVEAEAVKELVRLGPGNYVGEMSLMSQASTSARVAAGPQGAHVFVITRDSFDELLASDDKVAIKVYRVFVDTLCERLRKTTEELAALKAGR